MSECTGPTTFSTLDRHRLGMAGFAIPGSELRIAEDGEILMRGPHVFKGYYKNEAATAEALDEDGWLHSGDVGELDENGLLRVTDRMKELIITSGGKNIAPQPIEAKLKVLPGIAVPAIIGDRKNYLVALLSLDPETIMGALSAAGSPAKDIVSAATCPRFQKFVEDQLEKVNATLARFETIKRFTLVPHPFSIEGGELTPTMKLKRRIIQRKYAGEIEALYT
jgi:long-subunit acyl-CoA synthetase (AMP-forming)